MQTDTTHRPLDIAAITALRTTLRLQLADGDIEDAMDSLTTAAIESGGTVILANTDGTWGPHQNEVTAHGVAAMGDSIATLVTNWVRVATTLLGDDPADLAIAAVRRAATARATLAMLNHDLPDNARLHACSIVMTNTTLGSDLHSKARRIAEQLRLENKGAAA